MRLTVVLSLITGNSFLALCPSSLSLIFPLSLFLLLSASSFPLPVSPSSYSFSHLNYSITLHNNNFVLGKCRVQSFLSACEIRKLHLRFITSKVARTPLCLSASFPLSLSFPLCLFVVFFGKTETQIKQTFNHSGKKRQQKFLRCAKLLHRPSLSLPLSLLHSFSPFRPSSKKPAAKFAAPL